MLCTGFLLFAVTLLRLFVVVRHEAFQKLKIRIDASLSRQPLVKGERLVRYEMNAAML